MKNYRLLLFILVLSLTPLAVSAQKKEIPTVPTVDLQKFAGKWYEIGRIPNKFQAKCAGNVSATYTRKPNGDLEAQNDCLGTNGIAISAKGDVKVIDKATHSKLKASWGDFWIIDLDPQYQYAAVSDEKGKTLWILGRAPKMSDATYQAILRRVETLGFNPGKVAKTPQNVEVVKGAVIEKQ